jgi:hypothetical protein
MSRHYGGRGAPGAPPVGSGHYRGGEGDRLGSSRSGIRLGTEGRPGDFVSAEAQIQRWKSEFVVEIMDVLDEFRSQAVAPLAKQLQQLQHSVATLEEVGSLAAPQRPCTLPTYICLHARGHSHHKGHRSRASHIGAVHILFCRTTGTGPGTARSGRDGRTGAEHARQR